MNDKDTMWVCGLGAISSIGMDVLENIDALCNEKSGVGNAKFLQTIHADKLPVCEIKKSNEELSILCKMPVGLPRGVYLSSIASMEALAEIKKQISKEEFDSLNVGFISGNTVGGMDLSENFYADFLQNKQEGKLKNIVHHECGAITELVANHLEINDYVSTLSTACSSSANAIIQGSKLIKHKKLDIALVGGTDPLCRFTLNGFNTLMILDTEPCKPFDNDRKGLNLGEAAAYIVLVSNEIKEKYDLKVYAKLSGYANANDAFHQTASSAEGNGNYMAMQQALQMSGLKPRDINYINAHGTGTANNDSSEGIAIERLFENDIPYVGSTKANTGHSLGACGALEAVYGCMALQKNIIYPSLRVKNKMNELTFEVNKKLISDKIVNHIMSNSFGFGGNCTSLIFSKTNEK